MDKKVILICLFAIFGALFVSGCIGESNSDEVEYGGWNDGGNDESINNDNDNYDDRNEEPEPPEYSDDDFNED